MLAKVFDLKNGKIIEYKWLQTYNNKKLWKRINRIRPDLKLLVMSSKFDLMPSSDGQE